MLEPQIDGSGADRSELRFDLWSHWKVFSDPGHPQREQGFQPHRPGIAGGLPDLREDADHLRTIGADPPPLLLLGLPGRGTIEQPDGIFAMIVADLTELVEDLLPQGPFGLVISLVDRFEVFPFRFSAHNVTLLLSVRRVTL